MIRLILVRHGNTFEADQTPVQVGARTDLSLTSEGRNQAEKIAEHLSTGMAPKIIYAGRLKRQAETAAILSKRLSVEVADLGALNEIDYGAWEGLTSEEIEARWPDEYQGWIQEGRWPLAIFGGSLEKHKEEIDRWLCDLRQKFSPGDVVVGVTSNGLLSFFKREKVKTGHYCELDLSENGIEIKSWNLRPTLAGSKTCEMLG